MPEYTAIEQRYRENVVNVRNCTKLHTYPLNGKSRFHPITGERIKTEHDSPTPFTRIAYCEAWGLTLEDIKHYNVVKGYNYCATQGCCNPMHWRIYPKKNRPVPRTPDWIEKASRGKRDVPQTATIKP